GGRGGARAATARRAAPLPRTTAAAPPRVAAAAARPHPAAPGVVSPGPEPAAAAPLRADAQPTPGPRGAAPQPRLLPGPRRPRLDAALRRLPLLLLRRLRDDAGRQDAVRPLQELPRPRPAARRPDRAAGVADPRRRPGHRAAELLPEPVGRQQPGRRLRLAG